MNATMNSDVPNSTMRKTIDQKHKSPMSEERVPLRCGKDQDFPKTMWKRLKLSVGGILKRVRETVCSIRTESQAQGREPQVNEDRARRYRRERRCPNPDCGEVLPCDCKNPTVSYLKQEAWACTLV